MKRRIAVVGLALCIALAGVVANAGKGPAPPHSSAFGKSLGEWMLLYWTWALGGDQEGQVKKVNFLPLPDGVPTEDNPWHFVGELDYSMNTGDKFVLPMFVFVGEAYDDGTEDDPADFPAEIFTGADVLVWMDGYLILDSTVDDLADYYFDTQYFDPPIYYDAPAGFVWFKGIGFVHGPLSKGEHTLELLVNTGLVFDGYPLIFENTWNLTIE